ncbi:MAG: DNA primase [Bacteroidota bacterium]
MRIPDEKIEEIRSATDVVDIISQHVKLKKRGKNYIGLCPFHSEKTPSFTVSKEKQMYHCFGCHKGGNVFTFVMEVEKVSFVEAVRSLAERVGIALPEPGAADAAQQTEIENLYNVCRFAAKFFHDNLLKTDEGRGALEYFHKRGFTDETIRTFGLGYSLNTWDGLTQRASREGIKKEDLQKAGLVRARDDGSHYDYFRGRAMFPIFSAAGRVIGFGARKLREDDPIQGKYINSPDTMIYNKSRVLFGLLQSKESIRQDENAFLVEGYADLISLFQAGIQNVVASSGTALTEDQLLLIGRYTRKLSLVYDADSAGSSAMIRGVDLALEKDLDVRVVELPQGEDPDSFVQKHGGKEFLELAGRSVSFIDFKARAFQNQGAFATPEGKTRAVRSIVQSIAKIKDELKRNFYIKEVAQKYDVYETVLYRELESWLGKERQFVRERPTPDADRQARDTGVVQEEEKEIPPAERDLVKLLLEGDKDVARFIFSNISVSQLSNPKAKKIIQMVLDMLDEKGVVDSTSLLNEVQDDELKGLMTDVAMSRYELSKGWKEMEKEIDEPEPWLIARDAVIILKRKAIQKEMELNQKALKEASQRGADAMPFVRRQQELLKQMKEVEKTEFLRLT